MQPQTSVSARLIAPPGGLLPGEVLRAVLEVHCPPPLSLLEVDAAFIGVERVDQAWISSSWRSKVGAINNDARRVQRPLVHCSLCAACLTGQPASPTRRFIIQLQLPDWLPPSYRGTALRVGYQLQVVIRYQMNDSLVPGAVPTSPLGISPTRAVQQQALRCAVRVWPARRPDPAAPADERALERALESLQSLRPAQGRMHCWEVGAGADMLQVIGHLEALCLKRRAGEEEGESASEPGTPEARDAEAAQSGSDDGQGPARAVSAPTTRVFALRMEDRALARVILFPPLEGGPAFTPGDTISVCIDFDPGSALQCMEVRVSLESEEAVSSRWRPGASGAAPEGPGALATSAREPRAEAVETTVHSDRCGVVLGVPADVTPSFAHPLCQLRWRLCFSFTAVEGGAGPVPGATPWQAPTTSLAWTLPIAIVAPV